MVSPRSYTPAPVSPTDMRAMMDRVGIARIVIVQISVFGADNACVMDGLTALGNCARGVVQVDEATTTADLDQMHAAGVRGIRVNLDTVGVTDPAEASRRLNLAAGKCARNGWHVQLFASPAVIVALDAVLDSLPVPVVIDHFGLLPVSARGGDAEKVILKLLSSGKGWVKISGAYRLEKPYAHGEIAALARDLYAANPDHVVWGSDWPHPPAHESRPEVEPPPRPYRKIDPRDMLDSIPAWFEKPADWDRILVANPVRLYDFPAPRSAPKGTVKGSWLELALARR